MITIISKRKIGFYNPDVDLLQTNIGSGANQIPFERALFTTNGTGELQQAPDWVNRPANKPHPKNKNLDANHQNMNTWRLANKDGHVMEVKIQGGALDQMDALAQEAQARSAEAAAKAASSADLPETQAVPVDQLAKLNKTQLLEHAAEHHDLQLSPNAPKADIIKAIVDAQEAKAAAVLASGSGKAPGITDSEE